MTKLRLTALIPNYNHGRYLPVAVEAMLKQGRPPDELILIDDASTDGSQQVVDELAKNYSFIKVVKHAVNQGANASLQEGLAMATGDYFYGGGADDMILPGFFESAMALVERFPTAPICAGVPVHWREDLDWQFETCEGMPRNPGFVSSRELWPLARRGVFQISGAWTIFRVDDLKALGGFRLPLKWHTDWLPVNALALSRGLCWTACPAAVMRIHSASYSSMGVKRSREHRAVLAELARVIASEMPSDIQSGFRKSGVMGHLKWPIAIAILSRRKNWRLISLSFCQVWLKKNLYRAMFPLARALLPKVIRNALGRALSSTAPPKTGFDLSAMKVRTPS